MSDILQMLWACGVHRPEEVGVVCGACHDSIEAKFQERLRVVAAGARALALATSDPLAKQPLEDLAKLAEEGGR